MKTIFLYVLSRWSSEDSVALKFEKCKDRDDTCIVNGDQDGVKCELSFVLKDQVKKVPPLGGRMNYVDVLVVCEV